MISDDASKSLSVIRAMLDVSAAAASMIGKPGASPTLTRSVPLMIDAAVEMIDQLRATGDGKATSSLSV